MKELSIEEKAKRYDEALALMQDCIPDENGLVHVVPEEIFPELKESEDERIRKEIITHIKWCEDVGYCSKEEMIRWITFLEKQGEQPKKHDFCDYCDQQGSCVSPCPMKLVEKQGEQKPFWSEEDEEMLKLVIDSCGQCGNEYAYSWLKSLKERLQPQNTWKPSDEQIKAIRLARSFVTDDFDDNPTLSEILIELEEQLKKLKK